MKNHLTWPSLLFVLFSFEVACLPAESQEQHRDMDALKKAVSNRERYRNTTTAPSCLKLQLKDTDSKRIVNVILPASDLAAFLGSEKGLKDEREFVDYMVEHEGTPLEISFERLDKFRGKKFGNPLHDQRYLDTAIFDKPLTFHQLGVRDEQDLVEHYFNFDVAKGLGQLKSQYFERYTRDPAFIALLIDLGYDVWWGDYVPLLTISTRSFASRYFRK